MPGRLRAPVELRHRDPSDPEYRSVELVQRGRMVLDVAIADLQASEERLGSFHETTWHFRNALAEARRSWERLRVEFGRAGLESALAEPPLALMRLGEKAEVTLIVIAGKTYRAQEIPGSVLVSSLWRLTQLPHSETEPYYVAKLRDGSLRCDCAEWIYRVAENPEASPCKHLDALGSLGWLV